MPVHRVKGGWKWGQTGKIYPTLRQAERQARAIFAAGYRGDSTNRAHQRRAAMLLKASARAEKRFERDVVRVMRGVHAGFAKRIARELPALEHRHDADQRLLNTLFAYIRRGIGPSFDRMAKAVDADNEEALALFGISPDVVPGLAGILASAREEAIRRVQGAAKKYSDQIDEVLRDPENVGLRVEDLAELLQDRAKVSESGARRIAVTTTLRTNGVVSRTRMQAAGVSRYRWSGSLDERERPGHLALQGQIFSFDDPPDTGGDEGENNPSEAWGCRCAALPVIAELEEPGEEEGEEETAA